MLAGSLLLLGACSVELGDVIGGDVGEVIDCNDRSDLTCLGASKDATKVYCNCRCETTGPIPGLGSPTEKDFLGTVEACLPPELNPLLADAAQQQAIDAMTQGEYDAAVNAFCLDEVEDFVQVGAANLGFSVNCGCGAQAINTAKEVNPVCGQPCVPSVCGPNCGPTFDPESGLVNQLSCICNQLPRSDGTTTAAICTSSPTLLGILPHMLSSESSVLLDSSASRAQLTAAFEDDLGFDHEDTESIHLSGVFTIVGRQRADLTANIGINFHLSGTDVEFNFDNVDVVADVDIPVTRTKISGETPFNAILLNAAGQGIIPPGMLTLRIETVVQSQRVLLERTNGAAVPVVVDFASRTFSMPSAPISGVSGVSGDVRLTGTIVNQPPTADAGPDQDLECTSPEGTTTTLDGAASTDPDDNLNVFTWSDSENLWDGVGIVGIEPRQSVLAPFSPPALTTLYSLITSDAVYQLDENDTAVTVRDSTAPELSVAVSPTCLWAPHHNLVLFELNNGFDVVVSDICDTAPSFRITGITSNQPPLGGGSGQAAPDAIFGDKSFCVRSERTGTSSALREYVISVDARDSSGNSVVKTATVVVHHDQRPPGCMNVPKDRLVADEDPRCRN